ncbi:zinc finger BED domain-containing protein 4-like isoform X2 [Maniola hyperantus]
MHYSMYLELKSDKNNDGVKKLDDDEHNRSIWDHFKRLPGDERAVCKHCKQEYVYKGKFRYLKRHLRTKHPSENLKLTSVSEDVGEKKRAGDKRLADFVVDDDDDDDDGENNDDHHDVIVNSQDDVIVSKDSDSDTTARPESNSLQSLTPAKRCHIPQHKPRADHNNVIIDKCLVKLIAYDFQPITIVEDKGFKEFVHALNPAYELPSKETIALTLLPTLYEERWEYFVNFIAENAESVCLTVDSWSSRTEQFMGVTAHFFTEDLEMKSVLLQCDILDGSFTGTKIALALKTLVQAWRISDKIVFIVTDDASNMCNASDILNWNHFGCFERKLHSIVQDALNTVKKTIETVTKTVSYIKNNSVVKEKLIEHQFGKQNIESPRTVIKAIPTRWNSIYLMLERFNSLKEAIQAAVSTLDNFLPIILDEEWTCIQQICMILKPFHEVSNVMSEENYLTASTATVITSNLMKICASLSLKSGFCTPVIDLLEKLKQGLTQKLSDIQSNLNVTLCTLLDPRYKDVGFSDTLSLDRTKTYALSLMKSSIDDDTAAVGEEGTLESSIVDSLSIWDVMDSKLTSTNAPKTAEAKAREELGLFLKEEVINRKLCPLTWWRNHKGVYPVLYKIFKIKCNIVVTSIPCERAFSKEGYILNNRKTCLATSKVPEIILLNVNKIV